MALCNLEEKQLCAAGLTSTRPEARIKVAADMVTGGDGTARCNVQRPEEGLAQTIEAVRRVFRRRAVSKKSNGNGNGNGTVLKPELY